MKKVLWIAFIGLLGVQCAHKVAPSGGPEDRTPPTVVSTFPEPFQVNVPLDVTITITFSEKLNAGSVQQQVWMVPEPPQGFEVSVQKQRLVVQPQAPLEPDVTYQVVVGTKVADRHGNRLPEPLQLIFATGSAIDSGRIAGQVWGASGEGWWLLAHRDSPPIPDTLLARKAAYFVPLARNGNFQIGALAIQRYFLYALQDANGDRRYQVGEPVAFPPFWISLADSQAMVSRVYLRPVREDFSPPQLQQVSPLHRHTFYLQWNEPIRLTSAAGVRVLDSLTHQLLPIRGMAVVPENPKTLAVFTDAQLQTIYQGWIWGIADSAGNTTDTLTFRFQGTPEPDTTRPRILHTLPPDGAERVAYSAVFQFTANEPLDTHQVATHVWLISATGDTVSGRWDFSNAYQPMFYPDTLLQKGQTYRVVLPLAMLRTLWGKALGDTVLTVQFTTIDWVELGEIEGTVLLPDSLRRYPVIVQAVSVNAPNTIAGSTRVQAEGRFLIPFLPDGRYYLQAFVDRNHNGRWDGGCSRPFRFAEPFTVSADTLRVRKRWTTQGAQIQFY